MFGIRALARKLWALAMLLSAGYLWGQRGPRAGPAWRVGTVVCLLLLVLALLLLAGVL